MRKIILCLLAVASLSACAKPAETTVAAGSDFSVGKLFTVEGCSVYRFIDAGRHIYFTNCSGRAEWEVSNGKGAIKYGVDGSATFEGDM